MELWGCSQVGRTHRHTHRHIPSPAEHRDTPACALAAPSVHHILIHSHHSFPTPFWNPRGCRGGITANKELQPSHFVPV